MKIKVNKREYKKKKECNFLTLFFYACELFANLDDFLTLVITAGFANAVCKVESAALGALSEVRKGQLPNVGTSLVSASLRYFSLRYCHLKNPPFRIALTCNYILFLFFFFFFCLHFCKKFSEWRKSWINFIILTTAITLVQILAASLAQAETIFFAKNL